MKKNSTIYVEFFLQNKEIKVIMLIINKKGDSNIYQYIREIEIMGRKPGKTEKVLKAEAEIEEIIQIYESREQTIGEIADRYWVTEVTMQRIIRQYYERTGKKRPVFHRRISEKEVAEVEQDIEKIRLRYETGKPLENIANEYGVCSATIRRKLNEYYERTGRARPNMKEKQGTRNARNDIEAIIERLADDEKLEDIASEYGISPNVLKKIIKERQSKNVEMTVDGRRRLEDAKIVLDALKDGISIPEILECARKCNVFIPGKVLDEAFERWKVERDMNKGSLGDER